MPRRYEQLFEEIDRCEPQVIWEIGTWDAVHAVQMLDRASRYKEDVRYVGFDIFEGINAKQRIQELHTKHVVTFAQADARLQRSGYIYELVKGNTERTLRRYVSENTPDFVFIDGGHSLKTIANDWSNVAQHMGDRTVVIFDDYYLNESSAGCKVLVDSLPRSNYKVTILSQVDRFYRPRRLEICFAKVERV